MEPIPCLDLNDGYLTPQREEPELEPQQNDLGLTFRSEQQGTRTAHPRRGPHMTLGEGGPPCPLVSVGFRWFFSVGPPSPPYI